MSSESGEERDDPSPLEGMDSGTASGERDAGASIEVGDEVEVARVAKPVQTTEPVGDLRTVWSRETVGQQGYQRHESKRTPRVAYRGRISTAKAVISIGMRL